MVDPQPDADPGVCASCGTAYEWSHKWNSGNPSWFALPFCTCEEDLAFEEIKARFPGGQR